MTVMGCKTRLLSEIPCLILNSWRCVRDSADDPYTNFSVHPGEASTVGWVWRAKFELKRASRPPIFTV